ncbi:MAG: efflux RND transporter periplasmic adaptor subunit [Candidatus Brocadiaceae bacterium]|nr:efflux RND transporter periplasmic adaptor subunit [Candidatus Brocadiaceae bacterium]
MVINLHTILSQNSLRCIIQGMILFFIIGFLPVTDTFALQQHEHACETSCGGEDTHDQKQIHKDENSHEHGHDHGIASGDNFSNSTDSSEELYGTLLKKHCEHEVSIITCDECRYEVGVVKVDTSLFGEVVVVGHARTIDMGNTHKATGEVSPNQDRFVIISPRVSGVIKEVFVDWGERVKKGQPLALLDSIELGEARAEYLKAAAMLKLAEKNYAREQALYEKNITSRKHFLDAENAHEQAHIALNAMKEKLFLMGQNEENIRHMEEKLLLMDQEEGDMKYMTEKEKHVYSLFTITAPFDGIVIEKKVAVGELKNAFDPVITIADLTHLWVWFDVYEKDIPKVRKENTVTVSVASYPDEQFDGKVTYIGNTIDEKTRTVKVRAEVDNHHEKLKPGMFARVLLQVDNTKKAVGLPETAVQTDGQERFVFVPLKDGYFIRRNVILGMRLDGHVKVINGLESDDPVVIKGGFLLKSEIMKERFGEGCGGH